MINFVIMSFLGIVRLSLFGFIVCFTQNVSAQLKGSYTIGASGADYSTLEAFVSDFNKNGVNGDVYLNFTSDLSLTQVAVINKPTNNPTNSKAKLIINGKGKKLIGTMKREMIFLKGVDHVVIKNLIVENQYSASSLMGIRFSNQADSNLIDSCTINFSKLKSVSSQEGGYIVFAHIDSAITKSTSAFSNGIGNTVSNCFLKSGSGSPGPNFGILDQQNSNNYKSASTNNSFLNNQISNFYSYGIYMRYVNGEQAVGNKISRSDATSNEQVDSLVRAIFIEYGYTKNRTIKLENNEIFYLPYKGATTSSTSNLITELYGIQANNVIGDALNKFIVSFSGNSYHDLVYSELFHGVISDYGELIDVNNNTLKNVNGVGGMGYGVLANYGSDYRINQNRISNCVFGGGGNTGVGFGVYGLDIQSINYSFNEVKQNSIDSNSAGSEFYGVACFWSGSWSVKNNRIVNNTSKGSSSGIVAACYFVYVYNLDFIGNLLAKNYGDAETHGLFTINYNTGYNLNILQNTFYDRDDNNSSHTSSLVNVDDDSNIDFIGNIVDGKGTGTASVVSLFTYNTIGKIASNSIVSSYGTESWVIETNQFSDYSSWKNSGSVDDDNLFINSKFVNETTGDFRSKSIKNQNNVITQSISKTDLLGKARNPINSDRGCIEDSLNIRLIRPQFTLPDSICNGYEFVLKFTVGNDYIDTIKELKMGYLFNGKLYTETIKKTILPKDTAILQFSKSVTLNAADAQELSLFIAQANDFSKDDTLKFKTFVKKAPGGSKLLLSTNPGNKPYTISSSKYATILGLPVTFEVSAPTGKNNTEYGSNKKWVASTVAKTTGGRVVSASSITSPTTTAALKWSFSTADTTLEDSTILIQLKISDNLNGCDSFISISIYISPSPKINMGIPSKICSNDTITFVNKSKLKGANGFMEYTWKFGYNSTDSSTEIDGKYVYVKGGNYNLKLSAKTYPYGFVFDKIIPISATQTPVAKFTRNSGCEGRDILFSNITSDSTATMVWNFGDNSGDKTISKLDFGYKYSKYGTYTVVLKANKNGCFSSAQNKVTVFENPKVSFTTSGGTCSGDKVSFNNTTVMNASLFGVVWTFDENSAVSTQKNTSYTYSKSGTKNVKLVINSEFGCSDSVTKSILIKASPKVEFDFDRLCLNSKTIFDNKTATIAGTSASQSWKIDNSVVSTKDTFQKYWSRTGDYKVELTVQLDNGCVSFIEKTVRVLNEIKPDFTFEEMCSGDTVHFQNKTELSASDSIYYTWNFGNSDTASGFNVSQLYSPLQTLTYNVTLTAQLRNGCQSYIVKPVNVYELPKTCDFTYTTSYENAFWGAKLEPQNSTGVVGGQQGVNYQWNVKGIGNKASSNTNASVVYDLGSDGNFEVSMIATTAEKGCECKTIKTIVMNRANVTSIKSNSMVIYPNPVHSNQISIKLNGVEDISVKHISVRDVLGRNIPFDALTLNQEIINLELPNLAAGMYFVEVLTKEGSFKAQFQKN